MANKRIQKKFEKIAKAHSIPTLNIRRKDSLDYHSVAVWTIQDMLEQAYALGYGDGATDSAKADYNATEREIVNGSKYAN